MLYEYSIVCPSETFVRRSRSHSSALYIHETVIARYSQHNGGRSKTGFGFWTGSDVLSHLFAVVGERAILNDCLFEFSRFQDFS